MEVPWGQVRGGITTDGFGRAVRPTRGVGNRTRFINIGSRAQTALQSLLLHGYWKKGCVDLSRTYHRVGCVSGGNQNRYRFHWNHGRPSERVGSPPREPLGPTGTATGHRSYAAEGQDSVERASTAHFRQEWPTPGPVAWAKLTDKEKTEEVFSTILFSGNSPRVDEAPCELERDPKVALGALVHNERRLCYNL